MRSVPSNVLIVGLLACSGAAGCGTGSDPSRETDQGAASAAAGALSDSTWQDYMVLRNGRTCTSSANVAGAKSTATTVVRNVQRDGGLARFVIETTTRAEGSAAAPMKMRLQYREQADGTLDSDYTFPDMPGFEAKTEGVVTMPSIAMLQDGTSVTSTVRALLTPTDETTKDQILSMLDDGAEGIAVQLKMSVGPAPKLDEVRSGDDVYADLRRGLDENHRGEHRELAG